MANSPHDTEASLCSTFRLDAEKEGGWDMLLVRRGLQVGIQAKLKADLHVRGQALPSDPRVVKEGPHYRAVLVGDFKGEKTNKIVRANRKEFYVLARALRLIVLEPPVGSLTWVSCNRGG